MKRVIEVDGRGVEFAVSAALPRIYRMQCGRDIFADMRAVAGAVGDRLDGRSERVDLEALTLWENIAYCMAKNANPASVPERVEDWLDSLSSLPVLDIFPKIELLWLQNLAQLNEPGKK